MVKVCDAIMGSGKTSAAISYINDHPEKRFLYITPYLEEGKRVKNGCPDAKFVEPNNHSEESHSKVSHTLSLINGNRNIVSTHAAANLYDEAIMEALERQGYTIIIDEAVSVIQSADTIDGEDIQIFTSIGYLEEIAPNEYRRTDKPYSGKSLRDTFRNLGSKTLAVVPAEEGVNNSDVFYYIFSQGFLSLPNEIIVLTYLFEGSPMELLMRAGNIPYENIYIEHGKDRYEFIEIKENRYIPSYVPHLKDMIRIIDNPKLNAIGEDRTALSISWYEKNPEEAEQLQKNLYNYFVNDHRGVGSKKFLCGSYKSHWNKISGRGYKNTMAVFNERATNKYADRTVLAYPVNIFCHPSNKRYFTNRGVELKDNDYALSTMIQWIWRSAIRNGETVDLYIPSKRMRDLLTDWIDKASKEVDADGRHESSMP